MNLLPEVFKTEGDVVEFDPSKIQASLIKETGINESAAKEITELVVRRIISSGFKFLSGPHIREVICSILSEKHFEQERKLYTRIGMPLMDYEEILEKSFKNDENILINPEKIHHLAANQLANEYALLRILSDDESKAHLFGDIHIHALNYFDSCPMSQFWDPRIILKNGLPPGISWKGTCKYKPAENLKSAVSHLAKWIGMMCGEFCGEQGLSLVTMFLAPYSKGMEDKEIKENILSLIFDINQLSLSTGRGLPLITISSCPTIIENFSDLPAITSKGIENGRYADYFEECSKLFQIMAEVYKMGDQNTNSIHNPKHLIFYEEKWLKEKKSVYSEIWDEILNLRSPILKNFLTEDNFKSIQPQNSNYNHQSHGILQNISLNLPRYAYMSNNEDNFLEILNNMINLSTDILNKKYNIIQKRLVAKQLPLNCQVVNDQPIFNLKEQKLAISIVGLNEAIKFLTNCELHESSDALNKGKEIIKEMNATCQELSEKENKKYVLTENNLDDLKYRFAKLDLKHYSQTVMSTSIKKNACYTNSIHFREHINMELKEKLSRMSDYHSLIRNGALEKISLKEIQKSSQGLESFVNECSRSKISSIEFIP